MNRKQFLAGLASLAVAPTAAWSALARGKEEGYVMEETQVPQLKKSKAEWKKLLPEDAYEVLFEEDTERPWSSPLNKEKRTGVFLCAACFYPLFTSDRKYESGTGWPSFWEPIREHVATKRDYKLIVPRVEYHCARCGGHQGHVFEDGPRPTGLRYCNNGLSLKFVAEGDAVPPLRT